VHAMCIDGPAFDLLTTMTKFLALGLDLTEVVDAATRRAAEALRRRDLGSFAQGSMGDASLISVEQAPIDLVDAVGEVVRHPIRLAARGLVVEGRVL
jgi:dihydroorotase